MKRGRSRTPVSQRKRRRNRTPSRSRSMSVLPTPPVTRGRTMSRTTSAIRSLSRSAGRAVLGAAARAVPGLGAAMNAYDAINTVRDAMTSTVPRKRSVAFTNVKSTGNFGSASDRSGVFDAHAKSGAVTKLEYGYVKTESANNVVYMGHSTAPPLIITKVAIQALLKKLFVLASISIKSHESPLTDDQTYNMRVTLWYKQRDGDAVVKQNFAITANSTTLAQLTDLVYNHLVGLSDIPDQFLRLQLFDDYTGFFTGSAPVLRTAIDLTNVQCQFDCASYLKIQNRTINSTDNDEADNVDNVPISGKFFEFKTNGTVYQDYITGVTQSQLVSHPQWGVFFGTAPNPVVGTKMYAEVPLQSQFAGCKKSGSAHLDAGEIKTSSMKDSFTISWNKLLRVCLQKPLTTAGEIYTQVWLGKSRIFAMERLLNAQVNNATRQYNFAIEHQHEVGCTVQVKRDFMTAPLIVTQFSA